MARPGPAIDEERLPWLEPYRETIAAQAKVARRSHGGLVALAGALAVLVAAGGGYMIGQRKPAPVAPPLTQIAPKPATPAPRVAPVATASAEPVKAPARIGHKPAVRVAHATPHRAARHVLRPRKIRNAGIESAHLRTVRAAQEHRPAPTPVAYRQWPKMPSPGPAGQVIQLGAFTNPARANAVLRQRLARYPALGRMPRVVVPVISRPRGQILYVLRLGTTSRQQSAIVCRNLRASGDHCLVIG